MASQQEQGPTPVEMLLLRGYRPLTRIASKKGARTTSFSPAMALAGTAALSVRVRGQCVPFPAWTGQSLRVSPYSKNFRALSVMMNQGADEDDDLDLRGACPPWVYWLRQSCLVCVGPFAQYHVHASPRSIISHELWQVVSVCIVIHLSGCFCPVQYAIPECRRG